MFGVDFHQGRYRARCGGRILGTFKTEAAAGELYRVETNVSFPLCAQIEAENANRVRDYLMAHLGCSKKEVCHALELQPRTVAKAVRIIRGLP